MAAYMDGEGKTSALYAMVSPCVVRSAPRADQFLLLFLLQAERPLEHGRGSGLPHPPVPLHRLSRGEG